MPELPEVETVCRGLAPLLLGRRVVGVVLRVPRLRWPIDPALEHVIAGQAVRGLSRRAKYLLCELESGVLLLHLGMSGVLRVLPSSQPPGRHDHVDLLLDNGSCLRLTDPRRFGALLWTDDPFRHPLLRNLGPEPLSGDFSAGYLSTIASGRRLAIKSLVMDQKTVVGVGNIYASEALFLAGIDPARSAGSLSLAECDKLVSATKQVLAEAINQGGTTLRDFSDIDGRPGYFAQHLQVYGRDGDPCNVCGSLIRLRRIGGRSTYDCPSCQG